MCGIRSARYLPTRNIADPTGSAERNRSVANQTGDAFAPKRIAGYGITTPSVMQSGKLSEILTVSSTAQKALNGAHQYLRIANPSAISATSLDRGAV
jgi:hypothetical protein